MRELVLELWAETAYRGLGGCGPSLCRLGTANGLYSSSEDSTLRSGGREDCCTMGEKLPRPVMGVPVVDCDMLADL